MSDGGEISGYPLNYVTLSKGVQYVHWVMHKCIMVKVGGKGNTHKVCKKQVNFSKTGGKFFQSMGGNKKKLRSRGEMY